jgi:threonine synthase
MTCAWEIWEQMGRNVPDWLVAPAGHGGLLLGMWRGFQHLYRSGLIQRLPRLIAVQAQPYTPLHDAFHNNLQEVKPDPRLEQISADGIAISFPVRAQALLTALRQSNGTTVSVSEEEVLHAQRKLAQRGLFVEPTSATVPAALTKIRASLAENASIVAVLTGHGLKKPPKIE